MQAFTEQLARDRQHAQELVQNREETLKLSKLLFESQLAAKVCGSRSTFTLVTNFIIY
jgi:hypothetical protein